MQDVYKNTKEYNLSRKSSVFVVFDDVIVDMITNEKRNQIVAELFIREGKLTIFTFFITQSYFSVPRDVRLNCAHFFIIKIPSKLTLSQTVFNHSWYIDFKDCEILKKMYYKTIFFYSDGFYSCMR